MFVRQINSRLSRNASNIDENVLEYLNELHLDLQSGLSVASLLTLNDVCDDSAFLEGLTKTPEIIRDCALLSRSLATGLADLHKQYETAQKDSFTLEQVLKKTVGALENVNEAQKLKMTELLAKISDLESQLKINNENYEKRMKKAREHLTALGVFRKTSHDEPADVSSESSISREQCRSRSIPRLVSRTQENIVPHGRANSGLDSDKRCDRRRPGPYVAQVVSAIKPKPQHTSDLSWTRPWLLTRSSDLDSSQRNSRENNLRTVASQEIKRSKNCY